MDNEGNYLTSDNLPLHITLKIQFEATQKDYERDSFGPDYDEGLDSAITYVSILEELRAALEVGGRITLTGDIIELNSDNVIPTGVTSGQPDTLLNVTKDTVLNLNGHTISLNSSGTTTGSVINVQDATFDICGDGKIITNDDSDSAGWLNGIWAGQDAIVNIYCGAFVNFDFNCRNMTNQNDDAGNVLIAKGYEGVEAFTDEDGNVWRYVVLEGTKVVEDKANLEDVIAEAQAGN